MINTSNLVIKMGPTLPLVAPYSCPSQQLTRFPTTLLCDKAFPLEMLHTHRLTSKKEPTTEQGTDTIKVQLGQRVSFIGDYLQEYGPGVPSRSRNKAASQSWEQEARYTAGRWLDRVDCAPSK